ncbi:hypothetical protein EJB05_35906, partial [Eragrostis curvula]
MEMGRRRDLVPMAGDRRCGEDFAMAVSFSEKTLTKACPQRTAVVGPTGKSPPAPPTSSRAVSPPESSRAALPEASPLPNVTSRPSQLTQMGLSGHLKRWWDEEDEEDSDDDDLFAAAGVLGEMRKEEQSRKKFRGSVPGRDIVRRGIQGGHDRIVQDYFADPPVYNEKFSRRRHRSRSLFMRIVDAVESHDDYFRRKANAIGVLGASL